MLLTPSSSNTCTRSARMPRTFLSDSWQFLADSKRFGPWNVAQRIAQNSSSLSAARVTEQRSHRGTEAQRKSRVIIALALRENLVMNTVGLRGPTLRPLQRRTLEIHQTFDTSTPEREHVGELPVAHCAALAGRLHLHPLSPAGHHQVTVYLRRDIFRIVQ